MKNKKIIIWVCVGVLALLLAGFLLINQSRKNKIFPAEINQPAENFQADFLNPTEKQNLSIPADIKVQALKRNVQGDVMVYKIIRNDKDIVNPASIKSASPRLP